MTQIDVEVEFYLRLICFICGSRFRRLRQLSLLPQRQPLSPELLATSSEVALILTSELPAEVIEGHWHRWPSWFRLAPPIVCHRSSCRMPRSHCHERLIASPRTPRINEASCHQDHLDGNDRCPPLISCTILTTADAGRQRLAIQTSASSTPRPHVAYLVLSLSLWLREEQLTHFTT
jgi:hypothetical protein